MYLVPLAPAQRRAGSACSGAPECHLMRCAAAKTATKCCPLMMVEPTWNGSSRSNHRRPTRPPMCRHRSTPACRGSWSHGSWATVPCLRGAMCQLTKKRLLMWRPLFFRSASASAFYIFSVRWTPQPSASVRSSLGHYGGSTRRSAQQSRSGRAENLFYGDWYISFTSHSSRQPTDGS